MCFVITGRMRRHRNFTAFKEFMFVLLLDDDGTVQYRIDAKYQDYVYKRGTARDEEVKGNEMSMEAYQAMRKIDNGKAISEGLHFKTCLLYKDLTVKNVKNIAMSLVKVGIKIFNITLLIDVQGDAYVDLTNGEGVTDKFVTHFEVVSPALVKGCREQKRVAYLDEMLQLVQKHVSRELRKAKRAAQNR